MRKLVSKPPSPRTLRSTYRILDTSMGKQGPQKRSATLARDTADSAILERRSGAVRTRQWLFATTDRCTGLGFVR